MKPKKILGFCLMGLGTVLLIAALVTILSGLRQESKARWELEQAAAALQAAAVETQPREGVIVLSPTAETTLPETTAPTEATDPTDPLTLSSEFLDGHEYVGYLEFPSLDRKLPVMKIKYVEDLQIAPCLEKGSPHTDDAVICAHNYPAHFGPIRDWTGGEEVIFTDLEDRVISYTVQLVEQISPYDVEKVMESEYDLVLYTCTPGGANRVMIACSRTEASAASQ